MNPQQDKQQLSEQPSEARRPVCKVLVNIDGAIRPQRQASGLAAIVRNEQGQIRYWWRLQAGALTCNEAEYAAAIFALDQLQRIKNRERIGVVEVYSDSRVLVDQMNGRAAAHAPALFQARRRLQALVAKFEQVTFHHISREQNRLADALAYEAVEGARAVPASPARPATQAAAGLHAEVVADFFAKLRAK